MNPSRGPIHMEVKKSWWDGSITALCGATSPAGTYTRRTLLRFPREIPRCPVCQRLNQERGGRPF